MVNAGLPAAIPVWHAAMLHSIFLAKMGVSSVNQFLSKPVEFSDNSCRIRIESAPNRKSPLQVSLLAYPVRQKCNGRKEQMGCVVMLFLLRVAFWLTVVLALLPYGSTRPVATGPQVGAIEAMVAAGAAVSDVSGFCDRQPDACAVGANTAVCDRTTRAGRREDGVRVHQRPDGERRNRIGAERHSSKATDAGTARSGPSTGFADHAQALRSRTRLAGPVASRRDGAAAASARSVRCRGPGRRAPNRPTEVSLFLRRPPSVTLYRGQEGA